MIDAVSCVIITHDRDELLEESLRSVLLQETDRTLEVVVVDDLARPQTQRVVAAIAAQHPGRSVRYETTSSTVKGASTSRNAGARAARYAVLAFLDDDDTWEPCFVEDACARMDETGCHFVVTWMRVLERDGSCEPLLRMREGLTSTDCVARNPGMTGSNLLLSATSFFSVGGFDETLPVSNDKDLLVRLLLAGCGYAVVARDDATHRRHHGPQLTRPDERRAAGIQLYLDKHRAMMSGADRRFVLRSMHAIRRRTAPSLMLRVGHAALAVAYLSPRDIALRVAPWHRPVGRYRSV